MTGKRSALLAFFVFLIGFSIACSTATPLKRYAQAQQLERAGNYAAALHLYQQVLPDIPAQDVRWRSDAYYRVGECLFRLERVTEAYGVYQKAVDADPGNLMAHLRLGEMLLTAGALDKARDQAELVLNAAGSNVEAQALLGAAAAAAGDTALAEEAFTRVLEGDPTRTSVALALAEIYNRADRVADARRVLQKAALAQPSSATPWLALGRLEEQEGDPSASEQAYRKAVALEDTAETNLRLAQFLERAARIPEAEQVLRRVDALRPSLPTALPDFEVISGRAPNALDRYLAALQSSGNKVAEKALLSSGANDLSQQRAALAARLIEADLGDGEGRSDAQATIARARAHLEQYRKDMDAATISILNAELALAGSDLPLAGTYAAGAVALAPQSAPAHYVLGVAKYRVGDAATAQAEWAAAVEADSHFVPARLALAAQALLDGELANAESDIVPAVQDEPANLRALNLFARVLLARKRYASAALIARRALAVDNTAAPPHLVMGEVALQQRLLGEALVHFEQAVLLEPHSRAAIEGLTSVYRHGSITRAMLEKMEKVAGSDPPSATLMEITGRLYADRGWYADAERCLQHALKVDPQRATAAQALARTFALTGRYEAAADSAARAGGGSAALVQAFQAEERNDLGDAIRKYEAALREGERSGTAANNLAWLYAQRGTDLQRALALAEKACALNPANAAVMDTLGVVYLRRREYSQAIRVLESAHRLAAGQPDLNSRQQLTNEIRHHLSEAYLRAGQPDAAAALVAEKK